MTIEELQAQIDALQKEVDALRQDEVRAKRIILVGDAGSEIAVSNFVGTLHVQWLKLPKNQRREQNMIIVKNTRGQQLKTYKLN